MKVRAPARRQLVVAAGLIVVGVGTVAPAQAAGKGHDWSGVAACESGGDWSLNTGNGYFGGLQFNAGSWEAAGGTRFAPRADLATPAEQQQAAEKLLAQQGRGAWPTCGRFLRDAKAGDPSPAASSAPAPDAPAASSAGPSTGQLGSAWVNPQGDPMAGSRGKLPPVQPGQKPGRERVVAPWTAPTPAPPPKAGTPTPEPQAPAGPAAAVKTAVDTALAQVGKPYQWAAAGPDAFDCSGLMLYAWNKAGLKLPHSSRAQAQLGSPVASPADLQPGDLVGWYDPVSHVGMYVGNGQIVHASTSGEPVKVVDLSKLPGVSAMRRLA